MQFLILLPVHAGRDANDFLEDTGEVVLICETDILGDVVYGIVSRK